MKKICIFLILFCVANTACKKAALDLTDPTVKSTTTFYKNQTEVEQAVNGCYSNLQDITNNQWLFAELPSDNTTIQINPSDRGQNDRIEAFEYYNVSSTNVPLATMYSQVYNAIYNINYTLAKMPAATLTDVKRNQYTGELKFLRAYHYFNLVQEFGGVVLITQPLATSSDAFKTARSDASLVYAQIISDLTDAALKLPLKSAYSSTDIGRATKDAALSLLGKVYLTNKDYKNAETTLRQVLTMGYSLLPNYADVFDPTKKNGPESIFEVQYQGGNNLGESSSFIYTFAPLNSTGAVTGFPTSRPSGYNMPTRSIINEFEAGDLRIAVSFKNGYTDANGNFVAIPFINKYNHPHTIVGRTDDDWPVLRYSDVLLMLAEAINEDGGPTGEAYGFINQVRSRAGLAAVSGLNQTTFRTAVSHERRVELCFENDRWFQLKRTLSSADLATYLTAYGLSERQNPSITRSGVPFGATDYVFGATEVLFPIPNLQIFLDPNLKQNPGY